MKKLFVLLMMGISFAYIGNANAQLNTVKGMDSVTNSHGGGCRKSSPPGQCCHKETATGLVHCH